MAMPAVKHFDPVIGLDVHTVIIPPSPAPILFPIPMWDLCWIYASALTALNRWSVQLCSVLPLRPLLM